MVAFSMLILGCPFSPEETDIKFLSGEFAIAYFVNFHAEMFCDSENTWKCSKLEIKNFTQSCANKFS